MGSELEKARDFIDTALIETLILEERTEAGDENGAVQASKNKMEARRDLLALVERLEREREEWKALGHTISHNILLEEHHWSDDLMRLLDAPPKPVCETCGGSGTVGWSETVLEYGPPGEDGEPTPIPGEQKFSAPCPDCAGGES